MTTDLTGDTFEYKGWQVSLEVTGIGASGFAAGHADVYSEGVLRCRLTLAAPGIDRDSLLERLRAKASLYVEECIAAYAMTRGREAAGLPEGYPSDSSDGLWRLIYVSRALTLADSDVKAILSTARIHNQSAGITGALCFLDGVYLQYLEGDHPSVERLFERIARDRRHFMPRVVERCAIARREFASWTMALLAWDDQMRKIVRDHNPAAELDLYLVDQKSAAPMFRAMTLADGWSALH